MLQLPLNLNMHREWRCLPDMQEKISLTILTFVTIWDLRMFNNGLMGNYVGRSGKNCQRNVATWNGTRTLCFVCSSSTTSFVLNKAETREMLVNKMKEGVEVAKRTGVKWALVVPGRYDERLHRDIQTANIIDNLRYCCDVVEESGLTIVLEPLNTIRDHPGLILTGIPQAYSICRAVNRKSCKIVDDIYHQQITEGNLIPNIEAAWTEIAASLRRSSRKK